MPNVNSISIPGIDISEGNNPMQRILISGLINVETTLRVEKFPIEYSPVRYPFFGVRSTISGVGFNVAKALTILGDQVSLLSMIGGDIHGTQVYQALSDAAIDTRYVIQILPHTPQSVILYEPNGARQINVDLKNVQDQSYPQEIFEDALSEATYATLCNINFSRSMLKKVSAAGIPIATDVHSIYSLDDEYNADFMTAANILFCSDELLPCAPEEWAEKIFNCFGVNILVIGMGKKGALLAAREARICERFPPIYTRPIENTIGAGDALFSCFLHYFLATKDPILSLRKAMVFASYKIGESGAAEGFLSECDLEIAYERATSI
jgi:sugar/nucleoside kinase (ribokinase family)